MSANVYTLKVTLRDIRPPIWRRLRVAGATTLEDLHHILQIAFGWSNEHLHCFTVGRDTYSLDPTSAYGRPEKSESKARLDAVARAKSKLVYAYDFGDDWHHDIVVERVEEATPEMLVARCLAGRRAGPPEDCGGPFGYAELVEALTDPTHPEHEERLEWFGDDWDPNAFDIDSINERLRAFSRPRSEAKPRGSRPRVSLGTPLADDEVDELEDLLAECSAHDFDGLLGILHAVAVAPSMVPPSAWIPLLLEDGLGAFDAAGAQHFLDLVMRLHNEVIAGLSRGEVLTPAPEDELACESFAEGFVAGAELDPAWIGDDARWTFASWAAYLGNRPDLVPSSTRAKLEAGTGDDIFGAIRREMAALVLGAHESFAELRLAGARATVRRPASAAKVGRNDACPCGSGEKFKRCCIDAKLPLES